MTGKELGLRDRARRAVRAEVEAIGFDLFSAHGFEKTTVEEISKAAGMSRTSFFRYFPTKEDVVLWRLDELGEQLAEALGRRPQAEDPWESLRWVFLEFAKQAPRLELAYLIDETPELKKRHLEKQANWLSLLVPEVARRRGAAQDDLRDPGPRAVVAAAISCLNAATQAWAASRGELSLSDLVHQAMHAVRG
jgi:AcrR family transcriptional regulator